MGTGRAVTTHDGRTALATSAPRDELDAFQQAKPEELILPVRKLVQGVSRDADSKRAGEFYDTISHEYKAELLVAVLAISRTRSLFGESFEDPPLCSSDDAVKPRQTVEVDVGEHAVITGPTCAECTFSQWGSGRDGKGKGQACRMSYNVLCLDLDDDQPFILRVQGSSIKAWREYLTMGRFAKSPAYALETRIGSDEKVFEAGKAYVLTFKIGNALPDELAQAMREQAAAYRGVGLGVAEEAEDIPFGD